jgi:tRNA pseudouridine65 synthase
MEIEILHQDEFLIVVNKPANLLVHPYKEAKQDKTCLMKELKNQTGLYLYPIHRLDRPVSGIICFALQPNIVTDFQQIWHTPEVTKKYLGLVRGRYEQSGTIDFALGDKSKDKNVKKEKKEARTQYVPLELYNQATLLEIEIFTGRYHQIRRHFARTVNHILGDRTYGKKKYNNYYQEEFDLQTMFLHSYNFEFTHPVTKERFNIKCPLPDNLQNVLYKLKPQHIRTIHDSGIIKYE